MEARDTFPIGMDLKRGKCWGNNLVFRHSRCRKHRVSAATPWSMSSGHGSNEVLNPLSRDDPERARINTFITILAETPVEEWKPAILDEYLSSLLRGHLYRQAMTERLSNVRSGEEREALTRVDAFLTGYLGQERRKASRKKVSIILTAATEGAAQLDEVIQILAKEDLLDSDLTDYVTSLISGEENKCVQSTLLEVLRTVRDRIKVELETRSRPEIRTLAQALQIGDPRERKEFLQHAFTRLEDLDEFVKFVEEGVEYMGDDLGVSMRSNMPQENFDKMKTIYAEAAAIRRQYLQ
ncbi:unnamed protein product [Ascophyllum nodosum]